MTNGNETKWKITLCRKNGVWIGECRRKSREKNTYTWGRGLLARKCTVSFFPFLISFCWSNCSPFSFFPQPPQLGNDTQLHCMLLFPSYLPFVGTNHASSFVHTHLHTFIFIRNPGYSHIWMHDDVILVSCFPSGSVRMMRKEFLLLFSTTQYERQRIAFCFVYIQRNVRHTELYMQKGNRTKKNEEKRRKPTYLVFSSFRCHQIYNILLTKNSRIPLLCAFCVWDIFLAQMLLSPYHLTGCRWCGGG